MANCYNKKKRVTTEEFVINQSVSIAIPLNERTSSDVRRYPAKVIEVCGGDRLKQYIVATRHGSLKNTFRGGYSQRYVGDVVSIHFQRHILA